MVRASTIAVFDSDETSMIPFSKRNLIPLRKVSSSKAPSAHQPALVLIHSGTKLSACAV
jgi:hypothetical protein